MAHKIYLVKYNADMTEGRGPMLPKCAFAREEDACEFINDRRGIMGIRDKWGDKCWQQLRNGERVIGGDWVYQPFTVYANVEEAEEAMGEDVRKRALNKLTQEERKALGF